MLWKWIFNANGIANSILGQQILWSTDGLQAQLAVIIADTWKTAPFIGLLVLAGLQVIPADIYEAAKIDGANAWRSFWSMTLPLVKPALLVAVLFRILDNLRMFDLPAVLIGFQKPSVETLSILAYLENSNTRYGPAAAYAFAAVPLRHGRGLPVRQAPGRRRHRRRRGPRRPRPHAGDARSSRRETRREYPGRHDEGRHREHRCRRHPGRAQAEVLRHDRRLRRASSSSSSTASRRSTG